MARAPFFGRPIVNIEVGVTDLNFALEKLNLAISGPSLAHFLEEDAADYFRNNITERFYEEGDALVGFWPPLKRATIYIKRAIGEQLAGDAEDPNIRTGEMFEFLTRDYPTRWGPGFAEMDVPGDYHSLEMEYKLLHAQRGANTNPLGFGPTPPRPVLGTSEMQLYHLLNLLEAHIVTAFTSNLLAAV